MEQAIRSAVAGMSPGHVFTAEELAGQLGESDQEQVATWLDLLAMDGQLIAERRILSEAAHGASETHYRVPLDR